MSTSRRAFWSRPEIAALRTAPSLTGARSTLARSPTEVLQAIEQIRVQPPTSTRPVVDSAAAAARNLAASIDALDREIAGLAAEVDQAELTRLVGKRAALGLPLPDETAERGQMRDLLQRQLAVLSGLETRLTAVRSRRGKQLDILRQLGAALAELGDGAEPGRAPASEHVRSLVQGAARLLGTSVAAAPSSEPLSELPTLER